MAAATGSYIHIPQNMVRIMDDAAEEVGGVVVLSKIPQDPRTPNVGFLRVKRAEIVAGEPGRVDPSELLANHEQDPQWVIFHTHPPRTLDPQYMGLSYGDMAWILSSALTANGDSPKVSHLLFSDSDIHYTIVTPMAYKRVRDMLKAYVADRERVRVSPGVALNEFIFGMRFIFYIAETWIRLESSEGRADGSDTTALSILDAIWFVPDDTVTAYMFLDYERNPARYSRFPEGNINPLPPFFQWFQSQIFRAPDLDQRAIADINKLMGGDATASGLLYTWSMPKAAFLAGGGVMFLNDNGYSYINFVDEGPVQYNFQQAILNAAGGARTPTGGSVATADMKTGPDPPRLLKGGGIPSAEVLRSVAAAATAYMEKGLMKDVPPEEHTPPPPPDAPQSNPPPKLGITFAVEPAAAPAAGGRRVPKTKKRSAKHRVTRRKKAPATIKFAY